MINHVNHPNTLASVSTSPRERAMSAVKHTPGPLVVIKSASGKPCIIADHPQHTGDVARMLRDTPEAWATAQLFAAAPELLAHLQKIIDAVDRAPSNFAEGLAEEARAAIAKATGRAR